MKDPELEKILQDDCMDVFLTSPRKEIENEQFERILEEIRSNSIECLDLSGKNIVFEQFKALAKLLKTNTSIKNLNLSGTDIKAEGAKALAGALKKNTSITN
jgi:Ran GTPase-activating protein (RanGAP) involved in mRNA processing and transport